MRKVIQVSSSTPFDGNESRLTVVALCDDGTMWELKGRWNKATKELDTSWIELPQVP